MRKVTVQWSQLCENELKKRGCDPRRSRDTSSFGRLRSQTVLPSLNMVRGMAICRGRWILPREGGWSHGLGLWAVATRLTLFVFVPKYHQMCGSCQGQRSRAPFGKMRKNKTTKEQLFFVPLLLLLFVNAKRHVRHTRRLFTKSVYARVKHFQVRVEQSSTLFF